MYAATPIVITEMAIVVGMMFSGVMKFISVAVVWKGTSKSGRVLDDLNILAQSKQRYRDANPTRLSSDSNPEIPGEKRALYQGNLLAQCFQ
jgi:hypothetical protein